MINSTIDENAAPKIMAHALTVDIEIATGLLKIN